MSDETRDRFGVKVSARDYIDVQDYCKVDPTTRYTANPWKSHSAIRSLSALIEP